MPEKGAIPIKIFPWQVKKCHKIHICCRGYPNVNVFKKTNKIEK